jgi:Zn-finger protein
MRHFSFYGNLYECPYTHRLNSCPVYPLNNKSFEEKVNWFDGLTVYDKNSLIEHHEHCAQKRLDKKIF